MSVIRHRAFVMAALALTGCFGGRSRAPVARPAGPAIPSVIDSVLDSARPPAGRVTAPADSIARDSVAVAPNAARPKGPERPAERCDLVLDNTPLTRIQLVEDPTSGRRYSYIGGGVVGRCNRQDITIIADSAETYEQSQTYFLIGNVKYREKRVALDAQRATYFKAEERLLATQDVTMVMPSGSTLKGPAVEYYRAVRGLRPVARMVATSRPTLTLVEKDSLGRPTPPATLVANSLFADGDSLFTAVGGVVITRTDLIARGDSALVDNTKQFSRLMRGPSIESRGAEPFTLKGRVIDIFGSQKAVERVVARDSGSAVSKSFTLVADLIDMRLVTSKLDRAYAFGPSGARVTSPERDILADSIFVVMPDQRIKELHAVGDAYAESDVDTIKVKSAERDWMRGDTIVGLFEKLAPTDTSSRPQMERLTASGNASSYYQMAPAKGPKDRPSLSYTKGRLIQLDFKDREVQTVHVEEKASGLYLEATTDSTTTPGRPGRRPATPARPPTPPSPMQGAARP